MTTKDCKGVEVRIGDSVGDTCDKEGVFDIEEISDIGYVWGSEMNHPYIPETGQKNFLPNRCIQKIKKW